MANDRSRSRVDREYSRDSGDRDSYRSRKGSYRSPRRDLNYDDDDDDDGFQRRRKGMTIAMGSSLASRDPSDHRPMNNDNYDDRSSQRYRESGYYDDRGWRSHGRQEEGGGPGSKTLVLYDVPDDATERDVLHGLGYVTRDRHMSTDQVRLVRFHFVRSKRIATVEFNYRDDAEDFYHFHQPSISFPLEKSRGAGSGTMTFDIGLDRDRDDEDSRDGKREGHRPQRDWDCASCGALNYSHRESCFKCRAERSDNGSYSSMSTGPILTGETDEDPQQQPSQYIVIRNLEGSVTEELLARGVMKLFVDNNADSKKDIPAGTNKLKSTAPTNSTVGLGAKKGSLRRIFLIRDRKTKDSWRYGFAEFTTIDDAKAAVAKFRASTKFTIASKPVIAAFIHTGVFVPSLDPNDEPSQSFTPVYNPDIQLKYWDDRAYPSILDVAVDRQEIHKNDTPGAKCSKTGTKPGVKKSKKDKDAGGDAKSMATAPQMQMWAKKAAELHGTRPKDQSDDAPAVSSSSHPVSGVESTKPGHDGSDGPCHPHWSDSYTSFADWEKMVCLVCNWKAPTQDGIDQLGYQFYSPADCMISHEVIYHKLYRDVSARDKAVERLAALSREPRIISRRTPRLHSGSLPVYQSYADMDALHCHLCRRNFRQTQSIWRHEQESELHKRMLLDPRNEDRAKEELEEKGKAPFTMRPDAKSQRSQPQYRDRAQERREAFKQPSRPRPGAVPGKGTAEKRKERADETADGNQAKKSKGAGMLAKMGWTAGVGLGASGSGRTEAIAADVYAAGVGLGAEGSKLGDAGEEAVRRTRNDFSAFVEKTKDKARARFEKMNE